MHATELLTAHKELDAECRDRKGKPFISDWYCENPFIDSIFPPDLYLDYQLADARDYYYQNDSNEIHLLVTEYHEQTKNEALLSTDRVFVSAGLTALITAQFLLLCRAGVRRVFYITPLYYTYYFLANTLGIDLVRIDENGLESLGAQAGGIDGCLFMCDPIWFKGEPVSQELVQIIRKWQSLGNNLVFVDGAFQYLRWENNREPERTSLLDPYKTFRNICPTKIAAVHGPRFAYCIHPEMYSEELRYCYSNSAGAGSRFDYKAALCIMRWLNSEQSNGPLIDFYIDRYRKLEQGGYLLDPIKPQGSYFIFTKVPPLVRNKIIAMDQRFFDLTGFSDYVRLNLLLPASELSCFTKLVDSHAE